MRLEVHMVLAGVEAWLAHIRACRSPVTLRAYTITANDFTAWLEERDHCSTFTREMAVKYLDGLVRRRPQSATRWFMLLRLGFQWMANNEVIPHNPLPSKIEAPRQAKRTDLRAVTHSEYRAMLAVCPAQFHPWWAGVLITLWNTGARIGDVVHLKRENFDFVRETLAFTPRKTARGTGRTVCLPLTPELLGYVRTLPVEPGWIFPRAAAMYGTKQLCTELRRICDQAGVQGVQAHSFRRAFVTRAITAGVPGEVVAEMTGHSMEMIALYTRPSVDDKRAALVKMAEFMDT